MFSKMNYLESCDVPTSNTDISQICTPISNKSYSPKSEYFSPTNQLDSSLNLDLTPPFRITSLKTLLEEYNESYIQTPKRKLKLDEDDVLGSDSPIYNFSTPDAKCTCDKCVDNVTGLPMLIFRPTNRKIGGKGQKICALSTMLQECYNVSFFKRREARRYDKIATNDINNEIPINESPRYTSEVCFLLMKSNRYNRMKKAASEKARKDRIRNVVNRVFDGSPEFEREPSREFNNLPLIRIDDTYCR